MGGFCLYYIEQYDAKKQADIDLAYEALKLIERREFHMESLLITFNLCKIENKHDDEAKLFIKRYNLYFEDALIPWNSLEEFYEYKLSKLYKKNKKLAQEFNTINYTFNHLHNDYLGPIRYNKIDNNNSSTDEPEKPGTLSNQNEQYAKDGYERFAYLESRIKSYIRLINNPNDHGEREPENTFIKISSDQNKTKKDKEKEEEAKYDTWLEARKEEKVNGKTEGKYKYTYEYELEKKFYEWYAKQKEYRNCQNTNRLD